MMNFSFTRAGAHVTMHPNEAHIKIPHRLALFMRPLVLKPSEEELRAFVARSKWQGSADDTLVRLTFDRKRIESVAYEEKDEKRTTLVIDIYRLAEIVADVDFVKLRAEDAWTSIEGEQGEMFVDFARGQLVVMSKESSIVFA